MAFLASNIIPSEGYKTAKKQAWSIHKYALSLITELSSPVNAERIINIVDTLGMYKGELTSLKAIPGIAQYAKDQEGSPNYDVVAEFNAIITAIDAAIAWVKANFPADGAGYFLVRKWSGNGTVLRSFGPAATAGLVTLIQAVADSVE